MSYTKVYKPASQAKVNRVAEVVKRGMGEYPEPDTRNLMDEYHELAVYLDYGQPDRCSFYDDPDSAFDWPGKE